MLSRTYTIADPVEEFSSTLPRKPKELHSQHWSPQSRRHQRRFNGTGDTLSHSLEVARALQELAVYADDCIGLLEASASLRTSLIWFPASGFLFEFHLFVNLNKSVLIYALRRRKWCGTRPTYLLL